MAFLDETGLQHFYKILDRKIMCAKNDAVSNMATALKPIYIGAANNGTDKIDLTMGGKLDVAHTIYNFQVGMGGNQSGYLAMYNYTISGKSIAQATIEKEYYVTGYPSDSDGYCNIEISYDNSLKYYARMYVVYNGKNNVVDNGSILWVYAYQIDGLNRLPSYYDSYMRSRIATVKNLDNSTNGFSFIFVTDTHNENPYYSPNMIRKIVENTNVKTVICGGDYTDSPRTKEQTYNNVMQNASRFKWITDRVYMVRGNHDDGRIGGGKWVTAADLSTPLTEQLDSSITKGGDLYYYVDDTNKKVRLFILDSSNSNVEETIDDAQLSWFTTHVNELGADWTIAVFLHHALNDSERGDRTNITFYPAGTQVTNVLNSARCHVACVFCGHQHIDISKQMKYPVIATTCDASYDNMYDLRWSDDVRTTGTIAEQAFDVVHVDTVNKKVYCTRFGGGQNDITKASDYGVNDRVFSYDSTTPEVPDHGDTPTKPTNPDTPISTDVEVPTQDLSYFPTATEMRTNMGPGWNYGNQFESSAGTTEADVRCFGQSGTTKTTNEGLAAETSWGLPVGTQGLFNALYNKGIRTVRIPVAWGRHIVKQSDGSYTISKPFLDRVKTVVNYAYKAGLHIILNDHGDAWDYFNSWKADKVVYHNDFTSNSLVPLMIFNANDNPDPDRQVFAARTIWTLIANAFKDYDGHLMFEGCTNEILASHRNSANNKTRNDSWPSDWGSSRSWYEKFNGGYTLEQMQAVVDKLNNAFISAVRSTGGNNAKRVLQVQPLGAIATANVDKPSDWMTHMSITDSATDRIMVHIHVYSGKWTTENAVSTLFNKWTTETRYPIVLGETGNALANTSNMSFYTEATFIGKASKKYGIPCILWDNGKAYDTSSNYKNSGEAFKYIDRTTYATDVLPTANGTLDPLKAFVDAYNGTTSAGTNYVTGITLNNWPGYLSVKYGGALNVSGLTAIATYLDGTTKQIPNSQLVFSIPSEDGTLSSVHGHAHTSTENECYMTVSYTENGITVSDVQRRIVVQL